MMKTFVFAAVLALAAAKVNYTCSITPDSAMTVPNGGCTLTTESGGFGPGDNVTLHIAGSVDKVIVAGTFTYKIYEVAVTHFVSSGFLPYFTCDNKGCNPDAPLALTLSPTNHAPANFTLTVPFSIPHAQKTGEYHVAFTGQDQDHVPYDIVGTVSLEGTCTTDADCPAGSYCQNGPGHSPPFNCHA